LKEQFVAVLVEVRKRELDRAAYPDFARGGPSAEPEYPTFRDGQVENVLCDAVSLSDRERRWVEVTP